VGLTTERQPRVTTRFGKRQRIREEEKESEEKRTKPVNLGDNALSDFMLDEQRRRGEVVGWEEEEEENRWTAASSKERTTFRSSSSSQRGLFDLLKS